MIAFACPGCGHKLKVKDELAGQKGKCPHCRQAVAVPGAGQDTGDPGVSHHDARTLPPAATEDTHEQRTMAPPAGRRPGALATHTPGGAVPAGEFSPELYDFLAPALGPDELGRLGHYRVLRVLGAGGMGVVYLAEDTGLKRKVALKAMLPAIAASASHRERFRREAQAVAAIEHDNIVPIYHVGEDRGLPYLAMPLLKGETLEDRLNREGPLPVREALRVARETAEGLAAAHAQGVIHRDVKPSNVWLESSARRPPATTDDIPVLTEGGPISAGGRVKLLDFGLARAGEDSRLTQQGTVMGTPAFMAPEQANGHPVDERGDLFSLGCVLYLMVTGELPFGGADPVATLLAVATRQPTPPHQLNPQVPPALSSLILQLLAKPKESRPASARAVIDRVEAIEQSWATAQVVLPVATGPAVVLPVQALAPAADEVIDAVPVLPERTGRRKGPRRRSTGDTGDGEDERGRGGSGALVIGVVVGGLLALGVAALLVWFLAGGRRGQWDELQVPPLVTSAAAPPEPPGGGGPNLA